MPMKLALQRCPDAIVLKGDFDSYSKQSRIVTEIIQESAPVFEKASIDEFYIDASGMDKYVGCWKWSKELRTKIIKESGLPISLGLAVNKTVSKMATNEAKPNGAQLVAASLEKAFIAPMSTRKIPGVGLKTFRKLAFMGVQKIRILSEIPPRLLQREFGKYGTMLWKKANAIDNTTVKNTLMSFGTWLDKDGHFFDTVHFPTALKNYPFRGVGVYAIRGKVVQEFGFISLEVMEMIFLRMVVDGRYGDEN